MRNRGRILAAVAAIAVAGGLFYAWRSYERANTLPDWVAHGNGRIEMTRTDVAVKYPGRLQTLLVHEGDVVHPGQLIAQEDNADVLAQLSGAKAAKARAQATLSRVEGERGVREGQARSAQIDWREATALQRKAMVSPVELEQRKIALDTANSSVSAASGGIGEARAAILQADAQISQLTSTLSDMRITAPTLGRVEYRIVEPGTVLPAGGKIVSLLNPEDVYLTIFLPAAVAGRLHIGDEARIYPEGFDHPVPARVTFVSPDAQFTPKFVETTTEREKLSYRVKLQISAGVARRLDGQLKAGMTADGYVKLDSHQAWPSLTSRGD